MDNINELTARAGHLKALGIEVGEDPLWSLSIDDLRVYADIFVNPLVFLHFLEQRGKAFRSKLVALDDELDHIGLYLKHNDYVEQAEELQFQHSANKIHWHGFRKKIDQYYRRNIEEEDDIEPPVQQMPPELRDILEVLAEGEKSGRCRVASYLLDLNSESRIHLAKYIRTAQKRQHKVRVQPISIGDTRTRITCFCWQEGVIKRDEEFACRHTRAAMIPAADEERLLLEISFAATGAIRDVRFQWFRLDEMDEEQRAVAEQEGKLLMERRVSQRRGNLGQKIGRNEPCPCGSGRKYKRCHGRCSS